MLDSISLASKGADFGVVGDEEVRSTGEGKAYGFELMNRTKIDRLRLNVIVSYTYVVSQYKNNAGVFLSSSWDNRHIFNLTVFKGFAKNWSAGIKWRYVGGQPYTPYDLGTSSLKAAWDVTGGPLLDFSQINSLRLAPFHQLDVRVDKRFYFKRWSLMAYIDIQNAYGFKAQQPDYIVRAKDAGGNYVLTDSGLRYQLERIKSTAGTLLPTIGLMIEL